jgi:hypothetical protein
MKSMKDGRITKIIQGEFWLSKLFRRFFTKSFDTTQSTGVTGSTRCNADLDKENFANL